MFEFDQCSNDAAGLARPELAYRPVGDATHMSLLIWGEHCIECAAPACYTTCDLYDPRPDSRCRRFRFGARRNPYFHSYRGYGVEIEFKKWAKLEAPGNVYLVPAGAVKSIERVIIATAPLLDRIGAVLAHISGKSRYRWLAHAMGGHVSRWAHKLARGKFGGDAFLLEVYNPSASIVSLSITISSAAPIPNAGQTYVQLSSAFRAQLTLTPGYSRHEIESRLFKSVVESGQFNISLTPGAEEGAKLVILMADFVRLVRTANKSRPDVKCVVWDLDNTVWNGVLLEGSVPALRPHVLELIRFFDDRGILLSIASKNDAGSALAALRELGIADYFLFPQINWNPKSESIKQIAAVLNIGLDTFAFIDDNPFEREEVASVVPGVVCIDAAAIANLAADVRFQGSTSKEARSRRHLYRDSLERESDAKKYGDDYIGFLHTCQIRCEIRPYTTEAFERAAELVQRTNQLNFSGRKYKRDELSALVQDRLLQTYVISCSDKYGAYGTIGLVIMRDASDELFVEDLMISCRVQGKFLEQALFGHFLSRHNPQGSRSIRVNFAQTAKNMPARKVLETIGFRPAERGGMVLTLAAPLECGFILVTCAACGRAAGSPGGD